ncbi:MAG: hypothetical protein KMY55_01480 [Dethiosulfatibacter sp.]|nr:hypothetical protein [Dethiosulfatibacter sp.]
MYKDSIRLNDNFKYSINLNMDLHNVDKVNSFIASNTAIDILTELINTIESDNPKPILFVGPYGKGKSHLLLVLSELLYAYQFKGCNTIVNQLEGIDSKFSHSLEKIKNKRYLPIVLSGGYDSFKSEIIIEIKKRLRDENIDVSNYPTAFETALDLISKWQEENYANKRMSDFLRNYKTNFEDFREDLNKYNSSSLMLFKLLHRHIMYGQEFQPLTTQNITRLFDEISNYLIKNTVFDGVLLVLDEFSKLLEGSSAVEVYSEIQNLAELATNSSFRMICVAHKRIGSYLNHLSDEKRDEWKKIEGRFYTLYFGLFEDQSYYYHLIEQAVQKNNLSCDELLDKSKIIYTAFAHAFSSGISNQTIIRGAFPLNPYTTYSLIKLSERVAQNERTLFTFLCGDTNGTLRTIIEKSDDDLVGVDVLYDYFKDAFENNRNALEYKIYIQTETLLKEITDKIEIKIIKGLAVINIINEKNVLSPTEDNLERAINNLGIHNSVKSMIERGFLLKKSNTNHLMFLSGSGDNVQEEINRLIEIKFRNTKFHEGYDLLFNDKFILPKRHNFRNGIVRFFRVKFISEEMIRTPGFNLIAFLNKDFADGFVVFIVCQKEYGLIECSKKFEYEKKLVLSSLDLDARQLETMHNLLAINELLDKKKQYEFDQYTITELTILQNEYETHLNEYFEEVINQKIPSTFYYRGKILEMIDKYKNVHSHLNRICDEIYCDSPIMNYELLNKNLISTQAKKAREYLLKKTFYPEYSSSNLRETSAEKIMYKALVEKTGLSELELKTDAENIKKDNKYNRVLLEIDSFLKTRNGNCNIIELYDLLQEPPYGLRKGVIIVFLAKYLAPIRKRVVLLMGKKELSLDVDQLDHIDANPEIYSLYLPQNDEFQDKYLIRLKEMFDLEDKYSESNIYEQIYKGMTDFLNGLPVSSRKISNSFEGNINTTNKMNQQLLKELVQYDVNAKELLIDTIPQKIFKEKDYSKIINQIEIFKELLISHSCNLRKHIKLITIKTLSNDQTTLRNSIISFINGLESDKIKHIENVSFNKLIEYTKSIKTDDNLIIEDLAHLFTGLSVDDWNDKSLAIFESSIKQISDEYNSLDKIALDKIKKDKVIFRSSQGNTKEKYYTRTGPTNDTSDVIKEFVGLLKDYGFDDKDKTEIILTLLEKFLEGDI